MVELQPIRFRRQTLDWSRTLLMGVVNVTPDSFSDGGRYDAAEAAVAHGLRLFAEGADLIDVGGESTRPGAAPVGVEKECARVLPLIAPLAARGTVSIDTTKAEVADRALEEGAEIVNDVSGGRFDPDLLKVVARHRAVVVLGHLRGTPADMRAHATYDDVVAEVRRELAVQMEAARVAGVDRGHIWIDPGLGFAKRPEHNVRLLAALDRFSELAAPVVVGASRKSFLGAIAGAATGPDLPLEEREIATAAADVIAILKGANVVRVHAVKAQRPAVLLADAVRRAR